MTLFALALLSLSWQDLVREGIALQQQQRFPAAETAYRQSLELADTPRQFAISRNNLGLIYRLQGRYADARREYEVALHLRPER